MARLQIPTRHRSLGSDGKPGAMSVKVAMPFGAVIAVEIRNLPLLGGDRRRMIGRFQSLVDQPRSRNRTKPHQAMVFGASSIIVALCDDFAEVCRVAERMITNGN
jgi:hypothetical protein